jgi:hypothetical protein
VSIVAILGAGPVGASVAHRLAARGCVSEIRLIDADASVAAGKALDIRQSGPVERFDTQIVGMEAVLSAAGASAIVVADEVAAGEWEGERGLALLRQLVRSGTSAPLVFAGPRQLWLMEKAYAELNRPRVSASHGGRPTAGADDRVVVGDDGRRARDRPRPRASAPCAVGVAHQALAAGTTVDRRRNSTHRRSAGTPR